MILKLDVVSYHYDWLVKLPISCFIIAICFIEIISFSYIILAKIKILFPIEVFYNYRYDLSILSFDSTFECGFVFIIL